MYSWLHKKAKPVISCTYTKPIELQIVNHKKILGAFNMKDININLQIVHCKHTSLVELVMLLLATWYRYQLRSKRGVTQGTTI